MIGVLVVVVLVLLSAFVWPRWALHPDDPTETQTQQTQTSTTTSSTPTVTPRSLPTDASELLKAVPDIVLNYARVKAGPSTQWSSASPIEEYAVEYSKGGNAGNVKLLLAQWSTADDANKQYDSLTGGLGGTQLASGNVKVSGSTTGSYMVKQDGADKNKATAVWQNDTVVFEVSGDKSAVLDFYKSFPL